MCHIFRCTALCFAALVALAACAQNAIELAPPAPDRPWAPQPQRKGLAILPGGAPAVPGTDYGIPPNPELGQIAGTAPVSSGRQYSLAQLIDIAQRSNPETRIAWEQARQAALGVGIAEATFLPEISASAIAGTQRIASPVDLPAIGKRTVDSTVSGAATSATVQWLLFDFGGRRAVAEAARQNSFAANVLFNGAHQQVILDVTRSYHQYGAATAARRIADQTLADSRAILAAAEGREASGLATAVEVAQARQRVKQSELTRVIAEGEVADAYQSVLAAAGISPTARIGVSTAGTALPASVAAPTDQMIAAALSRRPDVAAGFAAVKASRAGIRAAEAEFRPKVFAGGTLSAGSHSLDPGGLGNLTSQSSSRGALVGVTIPIYSAGTRTARLRRAQSEAASAEAQFRRTQMDAATEVAIAAEALRSTVASYRAASDLKVAATITYDAAIAAYKNGVGTVTAATDADSDLLEARLAQAKAAADAQIAAANLAFAIGAMTQ